MWRLNPQVKTSVPLAVGLALALSAGASASAPPPTTTTTTGIEITAAVAPSEITIGGTLSVVGNVRVAGRGLAGETLALQSAAYPSHAFVTVAHLTSDPEGGFAFTGIQPDRNARVRVVTVGPSQSTSRALQVYVDPAVAISARSLGHGETRLSMRLRHSPSGASASMSAFWYTAPLGSRVFHLSAVTSTRELGGGITYAAAVVDPPAKRFLYRVCVNPTWEHAMGPSRAHRRCPPHDFYAPGDAH
jgi:hypothetical protein